MLSRRSSPSNTVSSFSARECCSYMIVCLQSIQHQTHANIESQYIAAVHIDEASAHFHNFTSSDDPINREPNVSTSEAKSERLSIKTKARIGCILSKN